MKAYHVWNPKMTDLSNTRKYEKAFRYVDARSVEFDEVKFIRELKQDELTNKNMADVGESNLGEQKIDLSDDIEPLWGEKVENEVSMEKQSKHKNYKRSI